MEAKMLPAQISNHSSKSGPDFGRTHPLKEILTAWSYYVFERRPFCDQTGARFGQSLSFDWPLFW